MMHAVLRIRQEIHYRRDAFARGLQECGYTIMDESRAKIGKGSVLVLWNRKKGSDHHLALAWENAGARVIVAENGYIGKDSNGHQHYALALHGHNGSGKWHIGGDDRFARLGIALAPWREDKHGHVLVCAQRGIGSPTMASPAGWHVKVADRLRALTKREIRVRLHPGERPPPVKLEDDLRGAYACVIWSSGSGVKALCAGVPVFYDAPSWICAGAAERLDRFNNPTMSDSWRSMSLHGMAWAQWSLAEIASGEAFRVLLAKELNA